jgi:diguanylate cyclase (GGDEF)-like protein
MWRMDPRKGTLRCVATWLAEPDAAQRYSAATRELVLTPGSDLPGRAAASGVPVLMADATEDRDFPRAREAREDGLRGVAAVPIMSERQLFAVLELATDDRIEASPQLGETLASIGRQMGQFVERKRAERDLVAGADDIAAVLDATRELARSTHADTARTAICEAALKVSGGVLAALFEPDPGGTALHTSAAFGDMPEAVRDARLPFVGGSSGEVRAFVSAEPVFVSDTSGETAVSRELKATGVRSCLFQPVVRDGRSIGVLTAAWSRPMSAPPERTAAVLRLLAAEAAVAIERADLLARLEAVARTDDLTGLANRRAWDEQLPIELARAGRERSPTCVAMLDLDHFKAFNDELGHQAGDRLLKAAAGAWRSQLRATDTLTRYGGEEFAVVLPSCPIDHAVALIERVRGATPAGQTCSAGVAAWDGEEPADALVARADAALYAAKNAGRDRVITAD